MTILLTAHLLTLGAAAALLFGQGLAGIIIMLLALPLDVVARRVAALRLKPMSAGDWREWLSWPLAGLVLVALVVWRMPLDGWGVASTALALLVIAEVLRPIRRGSRFSLWLFDRRPAITLMLPFAIFSAWSAGLILLMGYAGASLIAAQRFRAD
jgi:hypothetical protein